MTTPSIGRIVHFQDWDDCTKAAIVTEVFADDAVALTVFNTGRLPGYLGDSAGEPYRIPFAAKPTPGYWNWPPRV